MDRCRTGQQAWRENVVTFITLFHCRRALLSLSNT